MRSIAAAAFLALTLGCAPPPEDAPKRFEEVEVSDVEDSLLTTAFDEIGPRVVEGVGGLLPPDFPAAFPVFTPSTLMDFGGRGPGKRYLVLQASAPEERVRSRQLELLRAKGWRISGDGGSWRADRDGLTVRLRLTDLQSITELRLEY